MKKLLSMVSVLAAASAFAVPAPTASTVTFGTVGPDTYANGDAVLAGESYALVWSADGVFEGIAADGTPVDANDKVVFVAPYATKEGTGLMHCPTIIFTIHDAYAQGGQFDVFLLDTRKFAADGTVSVGATDGVLAISKAAKALSGLVSVKNGAVPVANIAAKGLAAAEKTALPAGVKVGDAKVTDITVNADTVVLKLEGTSPFLNYAASASATLRGKGEAGKPVTGKVGGPIYLVAPNTGSTGFITFDRN